jgi:hypothetical protein
MFGSLLFQVPITFLSLIEILDEPGWDVKWAVSIHSTIRSLKDALLLASIFLCNSARGGIA